MAELHENVTGLVGLVISLKGTLNELKQERLSLGWGLPDAEVAELGRNYLLAFATTDELVRQLTALGLQSLIPNFTMYQLFPSGDREKTSADR